MGASESEGASGKSTAPSSIATADSSLTLALPTLSLPGIPLNQPRYQPIGGVAPRGQFFQFVQPKPHLNGLGRPRLPGVVAYPRFDLHISERAPCGAAQEHRDHRVDRITQLRVARHRLLDYEESQQ